MARRPKHEIGQAVVFTSNRDDAEMLLIRGVKMFDDDREPGYCVGRYGCQAIDDYYSSSNLFHKESDFCLPLSGVAPLAHYKTGDLVKIGSDDVWRRVVNPKLVWNQGITGARQGYSLREWQYELINAPLNDITVRAHEIKSTVGNQHLFACGDLVVQAGGSNRWEIIALPTGDYNKQVRDKGFKIDCDVPCYIIQTTVGLNESFAFPQNQLVRWPGDAKYGDGQKLRFHRDGDAGDFVGHYTLKCVGVDGKWWYRFYEPFPQKRHWFPETSVEEDAPSPLPAQFAVGDVVVVKNELYHRNPTKWRVCKVCGYKDDRPASHHRSCFCPSCTTAGWRYDVHYVDPITDDRGPLYHDYRLDNNEKYVELPFMIGDDVLVVAEDNTKKRTITYVTKSQGLGGRDVYQYHLSQPEIKDGEIPPGGWLMSTTVVSALAPWPGREPKYKVGDVVRGGSGGCAVTSKVVRVDGAYDGRHGWYYWLEEFTLVPYEETQINEICPPLSLATPQPEPKFQIGDLCHLSLEKDKGAAYKITARRYDNGFECWVYSFGNAYYRERMLAAFPPLSSKPKYERGQAVTMHGLAYGVILDSCLQDGEIKYSVQYPGDTRHHIREQYLLPALS